MSSDVFISGSLKDRRWIDWVREVLESEGYLTDDGNLVEPVADISRSINNRIARSRLCVFLWSSSSISSPHVRFELDVALLHHGADPTRVIPILLDPIAVPAELAGLRSIRLWDATESEARRAVMQGIRAAGGSPSPRVRPPYPGRLDSDPLSFKVDESAIIHRQSELDDLSRLLDRGNESADGPNLVVVVGPAGSGKTTLLRQFAELRSNYYSTIVFVRGDELLDGESAHRLQSRAGPRLVVLDDGDSSVRTSDLIREFAEPQTDIVLLSREPIPGVDRQMRMEPLTQSQALGMVFHLLPALSESDAVALVDVAGTSPLALRLAADAVSQSNSDPSVVLAALARSVGSIPSIRSKNSFTHSLVDTFLTRFERTGSLTAAAEAESLLRRFMRSTEPGETGIEARSLLAGLLLQRHQMTASQSDLDESVALLREALSMVSPGHPERAVMLSNLAAAMRSWAEVSASRGDVLAAHEGLDESVALLREALSMVSPGHPERAVMLSNLAAAEIASSRASQRGAARE